MNMSNNIPNLDPETLEKYKIERHFRHIHVTPPELTDKVNKALWWKNGNDLRERLDEEEDLIQEMSAFSDISSEYYLSIALEGAYGDGVGEGMCTPVPALRQVKHKGGIGQVHNALVLTNELIKTMMHIGTLDGGKSHLVKSISTVGIAAYRLVASMRTIGKSGGELLERRMLFEIGSVVSHKVSRRGDEGHLPISVAELEGRMQLADGLEFICPKDEVSIGRYDCVSHGARGNLVLERIVNIITEIEA